MSNQNGGVKVSFISKIKSACLCVMLSTGAVYAQQQFDVRISFDQPESTQAWKQAMKVLGEELGSGPIDLK